MYIFFSHSRGIVIFTPGKKVKTTTATDFPITTKRHQNRRSRKEIEKAQRRTTRKEKKEAIQEANK